MTFALLFVGFGVKIGALPFHSWMMPAYQATPIPVAAALAGSMVNAGILGWLRFLPLGHTSSPEGGVLFIIAGAVAALYGVITGLGKRQAGAVLGGSSISQMGLITVIFGMGLLDKNAGILAVPVLIIYVVHHSLAKSSLFLGYDLIERQGKNVSHLQLTALLLPALALAGLPFTSGAIAKTAFKELALSLGEPWSTLSTFFFPVTAMTTTLLMLHFMVVIRCNKGKEKPGRRTSRIIFALSLLTVAMTLWLWPAASNFAGHSITGTKIMQGLWPIAGASFLFLVWRRVFVTAKIPTKDQKKIFDLDALIDRVTKLLQEKEVAKQQANKLLIFLHTLVPYLRKTEKIMGRWKVVGISYIALCLSLLFLLLL
jgi:formate hydrogenlyase subunit 3/multisubunit Na+/H+ antiporter MnhD subunit